MMDRRIDLTRHRDFASINHVRRNWDITQDEYQSLAIPFPTGNKDDLLHYRFIHESCSNDYCDRCGRLKHPWQRYHGLCEQCDEELTLEVRGRIPWQRITDSAGQNSRFHGNPFTIDVEVNRSNRALE